MAKLKRKVIGSIVKGRPEVDAKGNPVLDASGKPVMKPDYIKVRGAHVLKDGQFLNLETKAQQLKNLETAVASGKLSGDLASQIRERVNKIPDWVRFEVVTLEEEQ